MDPNEALKRIIEALTEVESCPQEFCSSDARDILQDIDHLGTWIKKGGFLPSDWNPNA